MTPTPACGITGRAFSSDDFTESGFPSSAKNDDRPDAHSAVLSALLFIVKSRHYSEVINFSNWIFSYHYQYVVFYYLKINSWTKNIKWFLMIWLLALVQPIIFWSLSHSVFCNSSDQVRLIRPPIAYPTQSKFSPFDMRRNNRDKSQQPKLTVLQHG